jgi:hypothetical protein
VCLGGRWDFFAIIPGGTFSNYGLEGPRSNTGGGRDFPPVKTGPGVHPASCTMGIGSFPGVGATGA